MSTEKTLARLLQDFLVEKNLSQPEAAKKIGVNLRTFENWIQGRSEPRGIGREAVLAKLRRLAK